MTQHPQPVPYYGRHHHTTTTLATLAGHGLPLGLMPEQRIDADTVAVGIDLTGPTPHLRLVSDQDMVVVELGARDLERILDEAAKVMARSDVELRVVS